MTTGLAGRCTLAFLTFPPVDRAPDGFRAFPGPERLAGVSAAELRDSVRAGYRAPHLARLAREVTVGKVAPESWETDLEDPAVRRRGRVSKSMKTICCQVPVMQRPAATGTVNDGPTRAARKWEKPLPSPHRRSW